MERNAFQKFSIYRALDTANTNDCTFVQSTRSEKLKRGSHIITFFFKRLI